MGRYRRLDVYNSIIDNGVVPLFYDDDAELVIEVVKALTDGGARVVEITNRGDRAMQVFQSAMDYVRENHLPIILGVGSVVDPGTASVFMNMGANFVVSPVNNPEVARTCNRRKTAYIPGCGSVDEISFAEELGAEIVKVFPGPSVGGPQFVKDLLGPLPWTNVMPTGGVDVTVESITAWFKAGVCAIGMGSRLITKDLLTQRDFAKISQQVEFSLRTIRAVRGT